LFATTKEMTKLPSKLARKPLDFSPDLSADEQLAEDLAGFYADPLGYVMYCLPWDEERSIQVVVLQSPFKERFPGALCKTSTCPFHEKVGDHAHGPDVWACEFLDELGEEIRKRGFDGANAVSPIRFSTVSGHDIGKSALTAWLIKFILDTRPMSVGTVTAMTAEQLKNKTWAELGKWHKMSLTSHWFDYTSGRGAMALSSNRADKYGNSLREQWKCTAQTCREENSEAFAGQHAVNSTSFYIFDEASGVPNKIFEVRDGGTTDGEPMVFDFGNPTRNSGRFFEQCQGRLRHRYIVRSIDSRDVAITNKALHQEWIDDYGIEDDYVKVRILGQFPSAGSVQFIPTSLVEEAMKRELKADRDAALVIGVDVAGFGDDESVVYPRIGYDARSFPAERYRSLDSLQLTGQVVAMVRRFRNLGLETAMIFIDTTGGLGRGPYDNLRSLGYPVMAVEFGSGASDKKTYRFKSDEIWGNMRDAMGALMLPADNEPNGVELKTQLTQREFGYTKLGHKVHLEAKRDMKARLGGAAASPDIADALACTFAQEVAPRKLAGSDLYASEGKAKHEYDPLEEKW